jgi:GTPase Era involved in 16S rRNA processing
MSLLATHQENKAALLGHLRGLAQLADAVGMTTLARDLGETRIPKLEEERFHLVVLGEFNHGKSTFVNALLGANVLPTGITPTTAAINHVVWAETPRARALLEGGGEAPIDPKNLEDWVTVEGEHTKRVKYVEVGYPAEILKDKVTLVDTPGVNDLNEQRAEITYGYVPRADAVLFLLDAGQALKESERAFIASHILERTRERLVFVLGKSDLLSDEELRDVLTYCREHLANIIPDPPIYPVSAKKHLGGQTKKSGMAPLIEKLAKTLSEDRGRVLLDNAASDAMRAAAYLRQNLGVKRQALELTIAELTERVAKVNAQLSATRDSLEKLKGRVRAEGAAVNAQIRLDLAQFATRFETILPSQIDAADAGEVKRFLPLFIQDKWKEWAEVEGDKIALLLERLAEEAIAVTNENAREATAAVADRLGYSAGKLEVDVDTFRYDLSVYAVGALGTTVFLFVNTLVGGLLTLASPILAIILHSKVSAEIKQQAKERAPAAVRKVAEVMGPHFEKLVAEFIQRLEDFITSAGDKLYAGIREILDRAISERRAHGDVVAPLAAEVDAQLGRLETMERDLATLRGGLWDKPIVASAPPVSDVEDLG